MSLSLKPDAYNGGQQWSVFAAHWKNDGNQLLTKWKVDAVWNYHGEEGWSLKVSTL